MPAGRLCLPACLRAHPRARLVPNARLPAVPSCLPPCLTLLPTLASALLCRVLLQALAYPGVRRAEGLELDPDRVTKAGLFANAITRDRPGLRKKAELALKITCGNVAHVSKARVLCYPLA